MNEKSGVKKKRKRGRPSLGIKKKTEVIRIRVTKSERKVLLNEAKRRGLRVPELLMMPWRKET